MGGRLGFLKQSIMLPSFDSEQKGSCESASGFRSFFSTEYTLAFLLKEMSVTSAWGELDGWYWATAEVVSKLAVLISMEVHVMGLGRETDASEFSDKDNEMSILFLVHVISSLFDEDVLDGDFWSSFLSCFNLDSEFLLGKDGVVSWSGDVVRLERSFQFLIMQVGSLLWSWQLPHALVSKESNIAEHGVSTSLELLPLSSEPGEMKLELLDGLPLNEDRLRLPN